MNFTEYKEELENRLSQNFDIEHDIEFLDERLDIKARSEVHNQQYFGSKNLKIWHAENYEYVLLKQIEDIDIHKMVEYQGFLRKALEELVNPHKEHMSTIITGVIIADEIPESLGNMIKNYKYRKTFAFSFKGWAEIRLIGVSLHSNRVISNKSGKGVEDFYLPILEKDSKKKLLNFIK